MEYALEYGQTFKSFEEAVEFTKTYNLCPEGEERRFLDVRFRRIKEKGFQCYLPHTKRFGMFIIGREVNAHI